jgi:hypothetical protein
MQWMRRTVTMNPESRFSSQSTSTQMYIQPTSGAAGFWTSWTAGNAPSTTVYVTPVGGQSFRVYMRYAWWNGSSWTYAGEWITSYTQVQGTSDYRYQMSYCAT